jgi:hypothetical protein
MDLMLIHSRLRPFSELEVGVNIEFRSRYKEKACAVLSIFTPGREEIPLLPKIATGVVGTP